MQPTSDGEVERKDRAVSHFMDRPVLSTLSLAAFQVVVVWLFLGRPSSPQAIALIIGTTLAVFVSLALVSRRRHGAQPYAERRQEAWASTVRWAQRHPRLARICLWWVVAMVVGETAFSIAYAIQTQWLAAAYYGVAAALFTWVWWSWMHIVRETPNPPQLRFLSRA